MPVEAAAARESVLGRLIARSVVAPEATPGRRPVTFDGTENNADGQSDSVKKATWMYGRDVRDQVANAPQPVGRHKKGYPSTFGNREKLPLQSSAPLQHIPLIPGQTTTHTDNRGAGTWRAVFNNNNRQIIDVVYHNANAGKTPNGRSDKFTLGHYYPQKVGSEADADEQTVEDDSSETGDDGEDPKSTEDRSTSDL
ncbi:hypothetical protein CEP52_006754 [Fusarium oligoseptatum]|uniref:Uncharacterized protein n=2 Tax=Fusarium solani species complex TaxID=232080 RepID=A0A428TR79_9HYPO|nr:hypothetical protein CEP52_006754 [Fusarium oligoseptatum]